MRTINNINSINSAKDNTKKARKAQEEMFGFIIIVVMLMVIGTLFLLFYKPEAAEPEKYIKDKIDNLLYSIVSYNAGGNNIKQMAEACSQGTGCGELQNMLTEMLDITLEKSAMAVGKQIKGYSFSITGAPSEIGISQGNLTGNMIGSFAPLSAGSGLTATLSIYY